MGQDSQSGSGGHRESLIPKAQGAAALLAALAAFVWFYSRLSHGLASAPWQGALLDERPINDLPVLTWLLARTVTHLHFGAAGWTLNVLSALFGALTCGLVAATAAAALCRVYSVGVATACAFLGALFFATSVSMVQASTAAGPAALTVFLGICALFFLSMIQNSRWNLVWLTLSALTAGLAAANHASFALLFFILIGVILIFDLIPDARSTRLLLTVVAFSAGASAPWLRAWATGESLSTFLYHGLRAPYPTLGDGRPDITYFKSFTAYCGLPALLLAVLGALRHHQRPLRLHASLGFLALICFGPLLPCLTNHYGAEYGIQDALAPRILVMAAVSIFAAWGLAALSDLAPGRLPTLRLVGSVAGLMLVSGALYQQALHAPNRRSPAADRIAKGILDACPEKSLLVCADSKMACFLRGAQIINGMRPDLVVLSLDAMLDPHLRVNLAKRLEGAATFESVFDPQAHVDEYGVEQPFLIQELARQNKDSRLTGASLAGLAIWDLTRNNVADHPICFTGVSTPWLTARARPQGGILVYPQNTPRQDITVDQDIVSLCAEVDRFDDPELAGFLQKVILSLSNAARNRGDGSNAFTLAQLALGLDKDNPAVYLALSRSEARQGRRDQAQDQANTYLKLAAAAGKEKQLIVDIKEDLQRCALAEQFQSVLDDKQSDQTSTKWKETTELLWQADQLETLDQGYKKFLERSPNNIDALYEQAAVLAQMGNVAQASEVLQRWRQAGKYSDESLDMRINIDGRFALIYLPERQAKEAETRAYIGTMVAPSK